jgi:transcription elongation factor GreB
MSKAFTRESDDAPERPLAPRPAPSLPPGTRNYITPDGAERLRAELAALERAGSSGPRLLQLQRALQTAEILPPPSPPHDEVRFGAAVTVRDSTGFEEQFRLVGIDETDPAQDWISWICPLARGLLNARLGQRVRLQLPAGPRELEIIAIRYPAADPSASGADR